MTRIRKAVFPVGGLGTRFLPATKSMPKEMLPIVDKPLIHYAFEEALAAGIEQFIFVTGRNKDAIENHFDRAYELEHTLSDKRHDETLARTRAWLPEAGNISFIRQQEPLGLGHAVWCARHAVGDEPFAVILADDLHHGPVGCLKQMLDAHRLHPGANYAAVMDVPREKTASYGILRIDEGSGASPSSTGLTPAALQLAQSTAQCSSHAAKIVKAAGLVEKPKPEDAPSTLSIIGRYILQPNIFTALETQPRGAGGEIQLTDAMSALIGTTDFYGYRFDGTRYDCGEVAGYIEANIALALARPDLHDILRAKLSALLGEAKLSA